MICGRAGFAERGPIGCPIAISAVDAQREHIFGVLHAPPGAGQFQALLRDIAMRAFDLAGADRQIVGQGVTIVQLVPPTAQIAMASAHRRLIVVYLGSFDVASERRQRLVETPRFQRVLLRVHPGVKRRGVWHNRLGGGA